MDVIYKLDGVDLRDYGVHVSGSEGLLSKPRPKRPTAVEWADYNGEVVDLAKRTYEPREIQLDCFIKAGSQWEFQDKCNSFLSVFDTANTKRLQVGVSGLSGENLVKNSLANETSGAYGFAFRTVYLVAGKTYTVSVNGNSANAAEGNFFRAVLLVPGGAVIDVAAISNDSDTTQSLTFTATITGTYTLGSYNYPNPDAGGTVTVKWYQVEEGEISTDYKPAIADLKPLVFEVYNSDSIDIKKEWDERNMVGTFSLKLTEPEPIKRVIKYTRTSEADKTVSITVTSSKLLNIYWGDGSHTYDVSGTAQVITHDFTADGTYYIVVTGNIDEITSLTTTGEIVWNKL